MPALLNENDAFIEKRITKLQNYKTQGIVFASDPFFAK